MRSTFHQTTTQSIYVYCFEVLEHVFHSSVRRHFDKHRVLTDKQHWFRAKQSCETQFISAIQEIPKHLTGNGQIDVILLDFAKVFDKIPHHRILHNLYFYGVWESTLRRMNHSYTNGNSLSSLVVPELLKQMYFLGCLRAWSSGLCFSWHLLTTFRNQQSTPMPGFLQMAVYSTDKHGQAETQHS